MEVKYYLQEFPRLHPARAGERRKFFNQINMQFSHPSIARALHANVKTSFFRFLIILVFSFSLACSASANLVKNPTFTGVTYSGGLALSSTLYGQFGTTGTASGATLTVPNWGTTGYNFVYAPGTADLGTQANGATGGLAEEAPGQFTAADGYGTTFMWGPNNGSANGFSATFPFAGNMIAADPVYETAAITQTITGLTIGKTYVLNFWWGGMQQQGFDGATTEWWQVTLGSQVRTTGTVSVVNHGFSGWQQASLYYTATATSETLSFLSGGTPTGLPPFALLGGVDLELIPESSNWMVFAGFGASCILIGTMQRRRRHAKMDSDSEPGG